MAILNRKPIVFISYAHADEPEKPAEGEVKWLSYVTGYLRAAVKQDAIELWVDEFLRAGAKWNFEIERKLRECDIFVLLCSHHSLSSDYVVDKELAIVRERQKNGDDVRIVPLLLTPTPKIALELVNDLVIRPRDAKPLSSYPPHERMERVVTAADEIAEMAAEMAGRPPHSATTPLAISDREALEAWLRERPREDSLAIAARAALRALPLFVTLMERLAEEPAAQQFGNWAFALFLATASARVAAKYPGRANDLAAAAARAAAVVASAAAVGSPGTNAAADTARAAAWAADADARPDAANAAANAADAAVHAGLLAAPKAAFLLGSGDDPYYWFWGAISDDVARLRKGGVASVIDAPLWPGGKPPDWMRVTWNALRDVLRARNRRARSAPAEIADNDDWQVWFAWYEERLAGGSRGEEWETAFATVPRLMWNRGAGKANVWIVGRLHAIGEKPLLPAATDDSPPPVDGVVSPVAYGWVQRPDSETQRRIAAIDGAHNLPFYSNAASEQDHQLQLALCRRNAEWLAKEIERTCNTNAIPREYEPALREYLEVLPQRAGEGTVVLAYDEMRYLYGLFERDVRYLPNAFASRLARLIENQLALNGFYDWPRRHQKAVADGDWGKAAFPEEAVARWRHEIEKRTPDLFERPVAEDIGRIEQAAPPPPPTEPLPADVVGPPPLPVEAPDPKKSRQYQLAAAANALWATFLKGKDLPVAIEGWAKTAQELGQAAKPFLDFLRDLMS